MLTQREELGRALQEALDRKTNPWGITVQSVEIRDVIIPRELEDAMSMQARWIVGWLAFRRHPEYAPS